MLQINKSRIKIKNPTTGEYEGVAGIGGASGKRGESMYEIAVRNGFTGTEEDFLKEFTPDNVVEAVKKATDTIHTHDNKEILDGITVDNVHKHENQSILDGITEDDFHTHENLSILAGITAEKIAEWNEKQDKPISLEVSLPATTSSWKAETDEEIKALGIVYRYEYTTAVLFSQVTDVSGSISPVHKDIAQTAGLLENVGYDTNSAGKLVVYFFAKKVPSSNVTVFLKIQR